MFVSHPSLTILAGTPVGFHLFPNQVHPLTENLFVFFQPGPYWSNCCSLQPSWDGNQVGLGVSARKASDSVALTPNYSSFSGFHTSRCFLVDFQSPQMVTLTIFCTRFTGHAIPIQFSHSVLSNSLRPHESQHARPPCPSPTPRVHTNSCPLSR